MVMSLSGRPEGAVLHNGSANNDVTWNDLEQLNAVKCVILQNSVVLYIYIYIWAPVTLKLLKIDPYCLRQKCSSRNLF